MPTPPPRRLVRSFQHTVAAPPEVVFPLLCPVREHDWVPGWQAQLVHSDSGYAEDHCVFVTDGDGGATWVVTRHEPPRAVGFAIFRTGRVERLDIALTPRGPSTTELLWTRTYTSLAAHENENENEHEHENDLDARMARLFAALAHYCATGARLET